MAAAAAAAAVAARLITIDFIYLCKVKPLRIWRDFTNALKKNEMKNEFSIRLTG